MLGLAAYDRAEGSGAPHLSLSVRSAGGTLLNAEFDAGGTPPVAAAASYGELGDACRPPRLQFRAAGVGQASVSLGVDFIPAKTYSQPVRPWVAPLYLSRPLPHSRGSLRVGYTLCTNGRA
jgi:hypothetical protein